MLKIGMVSAALAICATSANAQQWYAEEGQGVRSASIEYGERALSVNCVTTATNVSNTIRVRFFRALPEGTLTFDFGNGTVIPVAFIDGALRADTPATQQVFAQLVSLMKSRGQVTVSDPGVGVQHTFSLQGSSRAIGPCRIGAAMAGQTPLPAQENLVLNLETYLARLGFNPGAVDGVVDANTNAAISAYQTARGLPVTGGMDLDAYRALEQDALAAQSR